MTPLLAVLFALTSVAKCYQPLVCLTDPPVQLVAGESNISAQVHNPLSLACRASILFSDTRHLPITYSFRSVPCDGLEIHSFRLPPNVPSGLSQILWQCAGQSPTCQTANITEGTTNLSLDIQRIGQVSCMTQSIAPITTTIDAGSTTIVATTFVTKTGLAANGPSSAVGSAVGSAVSSVVGSEVGSAVGSASGCHSHWPSSSQTISTFVSSSSSPPSSSSSSLFPSSSSLLSSLLVGFV